MTTDNPENAKAWYHLGFWYTHLEDLPGHDIDVITADAAAAFEEALRLDPFNARMVSAVLRWYRDRGYQEEVTRLSERLKQIVPETAADRRLARVSWAFKRNQIVNALQETADESLIAEYRVGLEEAIRTGDYLGNSTILRHWHEAQLSIMEGDLDNIIDLSRMSFELNEGGLDPLFFALLKSMSMKILIEKGDLDEARRVARSVLDQEEVFRDGNMYECTCYLGSLAQAHEVLGDMDDAQRLTGELFDEQGTYQEPLRNFLPYMDTSQAVESAFAEIAKNPNWNGFDHMAVMYVFYRDILVHPDVQAYYLNEGKWIDYLAARMPEYAKYNAGVVD